MKIEKEEGAGMQKILLVGAGKYGKAAVRYYGIDNIAGFVDNNEAKIGTKIFGIKVISFTDMLESMSKDKYKVIISSRFHKEIEEQLRENNIVDYEVFSIKNDKMYYPSCELVINPYEDNQHISEEEWNRINQNNPVINMTRLLVDELKENVPLFTHIEIETINRCNGNCSFCPVSSPNDTREKKIMHRELFDKIIDELADMNYTGRIALFSNNEPLLDERLIEFHQYARKKLPNAWFHIFTNGTLLTLEKFKVLVDLLDELVIDNYHDELKLIKPCKEIEKYCMSHPELREKVTIVLRKANEILSTRGGDAPNRKNLVSYGEATCALPYKQMIVRPDGKVSLCCNDPLGKNTLGDLSKESILDVWYGEKFEEIRRALVAGRKNIEHCTYCDVFNLG